MKNPIDKVQRKLKYNKTSKSGMNTINSAWFNNYAKSLEDYINYIEEPMGFSKIPDLKKIKVVSSETIKPLQSEVVFDVVKDLDNILNKNSREKEQDYGPFIENIAKTARIFNELSGQKLTTEDAFKFMMALKLSRLSYGYKYDTYLDLMAYSGKLNEYLNNKTND